MIREVVISVFLGNIATYFFEWAKYWCPFYLDTIRYSFFV